MKTIRPALLLLPLVLAAGLGGCAGDEAPRRPGMPPPPGAGGGRPPAEAPVTTLAGRVLGGGVEPDAPGTDCPALLKAWLLKVDTDRDGRLSVAEAQADADALLAEIDANRDGYATPSEIEAWREKVAPLAYADRKLRRQPGSSEDDQGGGGSARQQRSEIDKTGGDHGPGRLDSGFRGQPDPIMAADANLDFRVDKAELEARVKARFDKLDLDHDGKLTPDELASFCPVN